jgi:hypothetical protein
MQKGLSGEVPMHSPLTRTEGRSRVARHVVILTLLTFGCATVRAPVSAIGPTCPVHGNTAEPQVELWLESAADPTPSESARAVADAREALRRALQDRNLWDGDILVVRAQAVSRTRSHRADQHAAIAGIVIGAVAIIALAVVMSGGRNAPVPMLGGRVAAKAYRPGAVSPPGGYRPGGFDPGVVPARPVVGPNAPRPRLAPPSGPSGVDVHVDAAVEIPPAYDAGPAVEAYAEEVPPAAEYAIAPLPVTATERLSAVTLPAPLPLTVSHRGFFDGDWVRLELAVVDARTGAVRLTKTVVEDVDVRDARRIRQVIDDALSTWDGWTTPFMFAR